ncbi:hypothetical protein [Edaphobacter aggregans]|uniref:hypothetical protein n=1 Tax=Edaphobacter aggregans TaxID=570835 RepID=UPI000557F81D|nr:hypothetical protein [Edaphobacter aggregans]
MKATLKSMVAKVMMAGLLGGAIALAGGAKAQAQTWSVGVQVGTPAYGYAAPAYGYGYGPDYYARLRYERERREAYERRQAWLEHERREAWEREHRYRHDGWRDRDWNRR